MVSNYTKEDINEINKLGSKLNKDFTKLFHIDNLNNNEQIYVYKDNNELLGFIHIAINYEIADILNIIVNENYRHQKIASILLDYMITDLPKNVQKLMLEVNEDNIPAIKLYYKFNFEVISNRKNYYNHKSALVMERKF